MASPFAIRLAARHIRNNGIIVYPTETVYGLGCDPNSHLAVNHLKILKQRESHSGFLLLASRLEQLVDYIVAPSELELKRILSTETATSWITKAKKHTPPWLVSPNGTIGFRLTNHSTAKQLCKHLNHPIISTSANIKGGTPVINTLQCHQLFSGVADYLLTSNIQRTEKPSVIRHLNTGQQIR